MTDRWLSSVVVVGAAYVAAQLLANVASLRIVVVAGFSVDAGTLVYPFTFTLRDLFHKLTSAPVARVLVVVAAALNVVGALVFLAAGALPPDPEVGPQAAFTEVLTPVARIVVASVVAQLVAELVDTEAYAAWVRRVGERWQWMRVLVSNSVSVPLDSALFVAIAFLGVVPTSVLVGVFWANVVVKGATTLVSLPWIYLVRPRRAYEAELGGGSGPPSP